MNLNQNKQNVYLYILVFQTKYLTSTQTKDKQSNIGQIKITLKVNKMIYYQSI